MAETRFPGLKEADPVMWAAYNRACNEGLRKFFDDNPQMMPTLWRLKQMKAHK